tara:strand:- start:486 stop:1043 length:558 start_codon:yes stop_codon:yes gene_type:complete
MNVHNLIVCDSKVIFDILIEIKEKLNCNLLFKTKQELSKINNLENYLVLSETKINFIDNQILLENFPIKIEKLLETINISFLKKNFDFKSEINLGKYKINLNSRTLYKQNIKLNLTEKETLVILYLKNKNKPCSVNELQELVWNQSTNLDTHTVETHIYRLRKKIKDQFRDDNFIISLKEGYKIN